MIETSCNVTFLNETYTVHFKWEPSQPPIAPSLDEPGEPGWPGQCDEITDILDENGNSVIDDMSDPDLQTFYELVDETFDESSYEA